MTRAFVSELYIYPVKGMGQVALEKMVIGKTGPENDRRWMLIDEEGKFISQRTHPKLSLIRIESMDTGFVLKLPSQEESFPLESLEKNNIITATIWKDDCRVVELSKSLSRSVSDFLGISCRLVGFEESERRIIDQKYALTPQDQVSFADGFPLLVITQESLDDLNQRLSQPVGMDRFRPNIVIKGALPYAEDNWKRIRIGNIIFEGVKPCSRCNATTVDQSTGIKGKEPLRTLAQYRNTEKGIMFGMNMIHHSQGIINLNDPVEVYD